MRKQYHPMKTDEGLFVWDVDRLVRLAEGLPTRNVPLSSIWELDEVRWFGDEEAPTCRALLAHMRLVLEADATFPIILGSDGRVMDGMHRVLKVALQGDAEVPAKQFDVDPEPDYIDVRLEDLPY